MSDATFSVLGLVVDPTGIESGVARGESALKRMVAAAMAAESAMRGIRGGADAFSASGSGIESGANRSGSALDAMAEKLKSLTSLTLLASNSLNLARAAFSGLSGAWGWLSGFVDAGAQVERFETQFAGLMGSFDKAKTLLGQIREYANKSPFEFPEAAQAARTLYSLTGGLEDIPKLLLTVGDAAAQGGQSLTQTADTLGRLYSTIKLGTGYDDPLRTLGQNGVVSPQLVRTVTMMVQGGKDAHEIWQKVLDDLSRNTGASERLSRTYDGLKSTLHDAYNTVQAAFGRPISDALKAPIRDLGEWLGSQDGIAAKFGVALGNGVKQLYGAFRTGQLSAYLQQEYDVALGYLRTQWDAFSSWAGGQLQRYVFGPITDFDYVGKLGEQFGRLDKRVSDALNSIATNAFFAVDHLFGAIQDKFVSFFKVGFLNLAVEVKEVMNSEARREAMARQYGDQTEGRDADIQAFLAPKPVKKEPEGDYGGYTGGFNRALSLEEKLAMYRNAEADATNRYNAALGKVKETLDLANGALNSFGQGWRNGFYGHHPDSTTFGYADQYPGWNAITGGSGGGNTLSGLITGTRSYVFGTEMSGGPDRSAQRDNFYDKDGVNHPEYRNVGAWNNTNLLDPNLVGAAVSPAQASLLLGIEDERKAIEALKGQMLQIGYNGKTAQARVVDEAPNSNRGIELTPAAHRAVGDLKGDAPISFGLPGGQTTVDMQKIMAAATVNQVGAGNGIKQIADELQRATDKAAGFGIKIVDGTHDVQACEANMHLLDLQVAQYTATQGKAGLSEQQANAIRLQARETLMKSNASYEQLAKTLGEAAAKQADYNQRAAAAKEAMGYNQFGTRKSLSQGAEDWMHRSGTSDEQYYKLMGDSLDSLSSRSTDLFSSMVNGSKSASQAFKDFAAGLADDVSKMIIKLLVLQAVQQLVGMFNPGGGAAIGSVGSAGGGAALMAAGTHHTGGMVGFASASTTISPLAFLGAPRFHDGGMLGLKADEVPIVALRGERVLNRQQTAEWNRDSGGGGGVVVHQTINYTNGQAGAQKQSGGDSQTTTMLGDLERMIVPILDKHANSPGGSIYKAIRRGR